MNTYIISYDLRKVRNYEELYEAIKKFPVHGRILESLWLIQTTSTAVQIRDYLAGYMDIDDGLFVTKSSGVGAWRKVRCDNKWLKDKL